MAAREDKMELRSIPETQDALAVRVERSIRQRTSGMIRGLRVDVLPGEVLITGRASTYYAKQLATHAALEACDSLTLTNDIEVY